jgi:hypothetical protein
MNEVLKCELEKLLSNSLGLVQWRSTTQQRERGEE